MPHVVAMRGGKDVAVEVKWSKTETQTLTSQVLAVWAGLNPLATVSDVATEIRSEILPSNPSYGDVYVHVHSKDPLSVAMLVVNTGERVITEGEGAWWKLFSEKIG